MHSVIFGGFSSEAIADRNNDAKAKLHITADGGWRRGQAAAAEGKRRRSAGKIADGEEVHRARAAIGNARSHMQAGPRSLVARSDGKMPRPIARPSRWIAKRRCSSSTPAARPASPRASSTPRPATTCSSRKRFEWVFDLPRRRRVLVHGRFGWVTGHSYVVYGPLSAGATVLMYEGAPNWPDEGRFWQMIEKYRVTIFYTAPTAIRAFIKWGDHWVDKHDLSSLRLLGTVGEGINPEAWMWYHRKIGGERCPIVDTWWQTETGGIMMSPLPGAIATKPGSCTKPLPGIVPAIVDAAGKPVPQGQGGWLVITKPWPGMLRGIWGDDERYKEAVLEQGAAQVSGRRQRPLRRRRLLLDHGPHRRRAERGRPSAEHDRDRKRAGQPSRTWPRPPRSAGRDELKGEAVAVFVTLKNGEPSEALREELKQHVRKEIGALAQPDDIRFTGCAAQDPQRQDHAPAAARHRQRQGNGRRHDDAGRLQRAGQTARRRRVKLQRLTKNAQGRPSAGRSFICDRSSVPVIIPETASSTDSARPGRAARRRSACRRFPASWPLQCRPGRGAGTDAAHQAFQLGQLPRGFHRVVVAAPAPRRR